MDYIRAAYWVETTWHYGEHPFTTRAEHWIRLDPPAHSWKYDFVTGGHGWSHDVIDARGHLHTAAPWKECSRFPLPRPPTQEELLRNVISARREEDNEVEQSAWRSKAVEEEGHSLIRHDREVVRDNFRLTYAVWLEPESRRFYRYEVREHDLRTGEDLTFRRCDSYVFNGDTDPTVFEMPPDRPIIDRVDTELFPGQNAEIPEEIRAAARAAIAQSDAGWRAGDPSAFGAAWQFETARHVPRKVDWLRQLGEHARLWSEWSTEAEKFMWWKGVVVQIGASTFRMDADDAPVTLNVRGKIRLKWADDGREWSGNADFYLRQVLGR